MNDGAYAAEIGSPAIRPRSARPYPFAGALEGFAIVSFSGQASSCVRCEIPDGFPVLALPWRM